MEDPIFEPWSAGEWARGVHRWHPPSTEHVTQRPDHGSSIEGFLRTVATTRLEVISRRLRMARHRTSLEDLLDEPEHLLRFQLTPWLGPLTGTDSKSSAMLEIGIGGESGQSVTAWYWLDRFGEAPHEVATVPSTKLSAAWIERVIVDFVGQVLERS